MFGNDKDPEGNEWREGIYLTTAKNSLEADILESKLRGEGIPSIRRYRGASNAMEIIMGTNTAFPIELYVPEETLEDARNIIIAIPLVGDELPEE